MKGAKGEPGQSISAPSLLQSPVGKAVNESQTAVLKCAVHGNPPPQVTWSKLNSSFPVGRHVVESSGALIVKDARPGDDSVYSCTAENLLGIVNATAKPTVQCKLLVKFPSSFLSSHITAFFLNSVSCTKYCQGRSHQTQSKRQLKVSQCMKNPICVCSVFVAAIFSLYDTTKRDTLSIYDQWNFSQSFKRIIYFVTLFFLESN